MRKKLFLVLSVALLSVAYVNAQFTFGARAGLNLTNFTGSDWKDLTDGESKFKPGFQLGVVGEYALSDVLAIQPGLIFAQQGAFLYKDSDFTWGMTLNYLQVPINIQYKLDLGGMSLLLQAGPYLGYGINGERKGGILSRDIKFGSGHDADLKAFDLGLGIGAGVQFSSFQVSLGYNLGLTNLNPIDIGKTQNYGFALTLTYLFGR